MIIGSRCQGSASTSQYVLCEGATCRAVSEQKRAAGKLIQRRFPYFCGFSWDCLEGLKIINNFLKTLKNYFRPHPWVKNVK